MHHPQCCTHLFLSLLQLYPRIEAGERPPVPPRDQLPGPDTAGFAGLDAYTALMK